MLRRTGLKASETEDIVDEEEFKLMKELREAKRSYKNRFEQLQKYRVTLSQSLSSLDSVKLQLATSYYEWGGGRTPDTPYNQTGYTNFASTYPGKKLSLHIYTVRLIVLYSAVFNCNTTFAVIKV